MRFIDSKYSSLKEGCLNLKNIMFSIRRRPVVRRRPHFLSYQVVSFLKINLKNNLAEFYFTSIRTMSIMKIVSR